MNIFKKLFPIQELIKKHKKEKPSEFDDSEYFPIDESLLRKPEEDKNAEYELEKMFDKMREKFYSDGFNAGVQSKNVGFCSNQTLRIYKNDNMSDSDYESFLRYLVVNGLELYYTNEGFKVRKNN